MQQYFVDGLGAAFIANGVVRLELCTQTRKPRQENEKDDAQKTAVVPAMTICIPVDGFANMVPSLQQLVEKLVKDGVIKQRAAEPAKVGSPNFN